MNQPPPPTLRQLFGGAIVTHIPLQFRDVRFLAQIVAFPFPLIWDSEIREVPNNQEVFVDANTDQ
ncbi:11464_t:CDS:2, partial [Ambispora leptoticha]